MQHELEIDYLPARIERVGGFVRFALRVGLILFFLMMMVFFLNSVDGSSHHMWVQMLWLSAMLGFGLQICFFLQPKTYDWHSLFQTFHRLLTYPYISYCVLELWHASALLAVMAVLCGIAVAVGAVIDVVMLVRNVRPAWAMAK